MLCVFLYACSLLDEEIGGMHLPHACFKTQVLFSHVMVFYFCMSLSPFMLTVPERLHVTSGGCSRGSTGTIFVELSRTFGSNL